MTDPNFLVIGAMKAGTGWLWKMLGQHPDIYVSPKKEINYFNNKPNYEKGIEWYRSHFIGYKGEKAIGEFTPNYLQYIEDKSELDLYEGTYNVQQLIYEQYPDIKLIVSLRDPVDRAISAYYHHMRAGLFSPFRRFSEVSNIRGITNIGYYFSHLCEWMKYFRREQIMILIYEEDIVKNKKDTLQRLFQFLGVDESFQPKKIDKVVNARATNFSLMVRYYSNSRILGRIVAKAPGLRSINIPKINISEEEISAQARLYTEESRKLREFLGRDLSVWKRDCSQ